MEKKKRAKSPKALIRQILENLDPSIRKFFERFEKNGFKIEAPKKINDRPIYATTLYLATCLLDTMYGKYTAYIFQDIIHKGYIIALAYGDIKKSKTLYTRIHSSCITSETLRGCDCDCVEQLNGAMEVIAKKGHGILFYLMQEGRGVGYLSKARDRMLVQASKDQISTFEAYQLLGLEKDYRQYLNIVPICVMLGIKAGFVLLTNNPEKVRAMKALGFKIKDVEPMEYKPSPYNLAYLTSKKAMGHILKLEVDKHRSPVKAPEPVIPFKPYALKRAQRFIYTASYHLPIRPIDDEIILTQEQFQHVFKNVSIDKLKEMENPLILFYTFLRNHRYAIKVHRENLRMYSLKHPHDSLCDLLHLPYWFQVHVYFDIVTDEEFVILTYGKSTEFDVPIVRIQSESLFNRFPVKDASNREKYKDALRHILNYGVGVVLLLHNDGRGAGLSAYAQDMMFMQQGITADTVESYKRLGINYDLRDYESALILLKEHLISSRVQMVMNTPSSLVRKTEYTESLNKVGLEVEHWIFLEEENLQL